MPIMFSSMDVPGFSVQINGRIVGFVLVLVVGDFGRGEGTAKLAFDDAAVCAIIGAVSHGLAFLPLGEKLTAHILSVGGRDCLCDLGARHVGKIHRFPSIFYTSGMTNICADTLGAVVNDISRARSSCLATPNGELVFWVVWGLPNPISREEAMSIER